MAYSLHLGMATDMCGCDLDGYEKLRTSCILMSVVIAVIPRQFTSINWKHFAHLGVPCVLCKQCAQKCLRLEICEQKYPKSIYLCTVKACNAMNWQGGVWPSAFNAGFPIDLCWVPLVCALQICTAADQRLIFNYLHFRNTILFCSVMVKIAVNCCHAIKLAISHIIFINIYKFISEI